MTNAEKYLKDENYTKDFISDYMIYCVRNKQDSVNLESLSLFFREEAKPTLTGDERAILRNIAYDSEYKYIYRSLGMLYLSENEKLTCVDRLPAMHHLFQFIKERRRI